MTERLYYSDSFLTTFDAQVTEAAEGGLRIYLDRTAFYPTSGGQPNDGGTLGGAAVLDVVDEGERIAHVVGSPLTSGIDVRGAVDWVRRWDHMQQHTGQHLLSAVFQEVLGMATVSFHLGREISTIDLAAAALSAAQMEAVELAANERVWEDRPVAVSYEDAAEANRDLRKASDREGVLRIVSIVGLDRSACGGTHVRSTGGIGAIQIRGLDKIRGNVRVEFVCGRRATVCARRDLDRLTEIARMFSSPAEETPSLVRITLDRLSEAEKARKKLASELASFEGRQLHSATAPSADGVKRVVRRISKGAIDDAVRILAQSFANEGKAVMLVLIEDSPAILMAASKDSGINAGEMLKALLAANGGRGGGNAQVAQGTVPNREALEKVAASMGW